MNRRRILLSYLANSFSWELYSKVYFYNELVPTTINTKNVLNKAKIVKVSGNGVIENQLVQNGDFSNGTTSWYAQEGTLSVANNQATVVASTTNLTYGVRQFLSQTIPSGSKILLVAKATTTTPALSYKFGIPGLNFNETPIYQNGLFIVLATLSNNATYFDFRIRGENQSLITAGDTMTIDYIKIINLTHREGTGNEPTSLADNRIQALLNRGYIPYNLGKYKGTDIGEFKSEPYNLFDGELSIGTLSNSNTTNCHSDNFISVVSGRTYAFENGDLYTNSNNGFYYMEYDENKNAITSNSVAIYGALGQANKVSTFSVGNTTKYIKFFLYIDGYNFTNNFPTQLSIHQSGTRTGYAEHKTFTPITFKAQLNGAINSHDTMEITNTDYVFTRNIGVVDLGSLDWYWRSSDARFNSTTTITNIKPSSSNYVVPNILCYKYTTVKADGATNLDKIVSLYSASNVNYIWIMDSAYTSNSSLKTSLSGVYLYYELATPQVITIPKKHLGIVDLGSLNWVSSSSYGAYSSSLSTLAKKPSNNNTTPNIYCSLYTTSYRSHYSNNDRKLITIDQSGDLDIEDSSLIGLTNAQIQAKLSGILIFVETENEVADITNVVDIESGGTITTDSEVLPNIELSVKCK